MQSFTKIQVALDTQLLTVAGVVASGANANFIAENTPNYLTASIPNAQANLFVRSTLVPAKTLNETIGTDGYVRANGLYMVDVIARLNTGYAGAKGLADDILAVFPAGEMLSLTNGDEITIEVASMAPNVTMGAWAMAGFYAVQVQVSWFGFVQP